MHVSILRPAAKQIVLIGGGRNAHNLVGMFEDVGIEIAAILDDAPGAPVLGRPVTAIDAYEGSDRAAIMAVAAPAARRVLEQRPALAAMIWTSYVDPRSVVSRYASIGSGAFIGPFAACADVAIGRHAMVMAGVVLGARVAVGDFSNVLPNATVASDVRIGEGCVIGMGARIEAGVTIGDGCRVAANVVVRHDMPDGSLAVPRTRTRIIRKSSARTVSDSLNTEEMDS